jgi:hypothetical protein
MGRQRIAMATAAIVAAVCSGPLTSASAATEAGVTTVARAVAGGRWGVAQEVPGTAALNLAGGADVYSISCGSAGNCSAGGAYEYKIERWEPFVVSETHGAWGTAIEVPGIAALNKRHAAGIASVSCASAGNCSAGGSYTGGSGKDQVFVVGEKKGTWDTAIELPGIAALNVGGDAGLSSISCASPGNCAAGGSYAQGHFLAQAFVVSQTNGTWGTAVQVPGIAALNTGQQAQVNSVSCASPGYCSAGGYYSNKAGAQEAFVVDETNGTWGTAQPVPGAVNPGGAVTSVSCGKAGYCSAGGYSYIEGRQQPFVVSETNGTWGQAAELPGIAVLNTGPLAGITSVSCASAGNCSAGGQYSTGRKHLAIHQQAFVVSEVNGTWGTAEEVPGSGALNPGGIAQVNSVSCGSPGNCSAGGYTNGNANGTAFVVDETNGNWGTAHQVRGTPGYLGAEVETMSCVPAGSCSAGGFYNNSTVAGEQAFVVDKTTGS